MISAFSNIAAYINAGGRGTRLKPVFRPDPVLGVSKALIQIGTPPITLVEHAINKLLRAGVPRIVVGVGDHENVSYHIKTVYPDHNDIYIIQHLNQLGHGGDLIRGVREHGDFFGKQLLIVNVDTLVDINERNLLDFHNYKNADLTIALTQNAGVPNEGAYCVDKEDKVLYSAEVSVSLTNDQDFSNVAYRGSSTGVIIVQTELIHNLEWQPHNGPISLYSDILATVLSHDRVYAFNNGTRKFTDVGTPSSWHDFIQNINVWQPYIHYANRTNIATRQ